MEEFSQNGDDDEESEDFEIEYEEEFDDEERRDPFEELMRMIE